MFQFIFADKMINKTSKRPPRVDALVCLLLLFLLLLRPPGCPPPASRCCVLDPRHNNKSRKC